MTSRSIDQALPCPGDPQIHEANMPSAKGYLVLVKQRNGPIPQPFDYPWGDSLEVMAARKPRVESSI